MKRQYGVISFDDILGNCQRSCSGDILMLIKIYLGSPIAPYILMLFEIGLRVTKSTAYIDVD